MVSIKSIIALTLLAAACADATFVDPSALRACSEGYYTRWGLSYADEWKHSTGLLGSVFDLVGGLLNTVSNLLENLLGGLLGSKAGLLNSIFQKPHTKGEVFDVLIKIGILNAPIYERINKGLASIYLRVYLANILIALSVRGESYEGLSVKLLVGDQNKWLSQLGCQNIKQEWEAHLRSIGGLSSLSKAKRIHYNLIQNLVNNLVNGVDGFVDSLLDEVLTTVFSILGLLSNLLNDKLDLVLNELSQLVDGIVLNVGIGELFASVKTKVSSYTSTQFDTCYTNL